MERKLAGELDFYVRGSEKFRSRGITCFGARNIVRSENVDDSSQGCAFGGNPIRVHTRIRLFFLKSQSIDKGICNSKLTQHNHNERRTRT